MGGSKDGEEGVSVFEKKKELPAGDGCPSEHPRLGEGEGRSQKWVPG